MVIRGTTLVTALRFNPVQYGAVTLKNHASSPGAVWAVVDPLDQIIRPNLTQRTPQLASAAVSILVTGG